MKKRIYEILSVSNHKGSLSWYFDLFLIILIALNVLTLIIGTVQSIYQQYRYFFISFEYFSVIFFSIEYVLRIWTANEDPKYRKPVTGNLTWAITPLAIIDLLAVLPFYLPFLGIDLRSFWLMRLFRLFRLFKIARYMSAIRMIRNVFLDKKEELLISLVFTVFMLLISSSVMYYIENSAQPDNFSSIPQTMWWSIATLTTVGYGDVYPITTLGKLLGGLIAILGVGLFALPAGILASGFSDQIAKKNQKSIQCPKCGEEFAK